jgi:integrase
MRSTPLLDCAGRRRSPATMSGFHEGRPPRNKGLHYPPDPPTVEEIIAVMRAAGDRPDGLRLRGVIIVLWRAGLRISEALALAESDLDRTNTRRRARAPGQGRQAPRGRDESVGLGAARAVAQHPCGPAGRRALLRAPGTHPRPPLLPRRDPHAAAKCCPHGWRQAPVRTAPAPPRSRRGDVSRRRAAGRHTAATRSC